MRAFIVIAITLSTIAALAGQPFVAADQHSGFYAINNNGQAVGENMYPNYHTSAIMFDGATHLIADPYPYSTASASDIDDAGDVCFDAGGVSPRLYSCSTGTSIGLFANEMGYSREAPYSGCVKINNNGLVIANYYKHEMVITTQYGFTWPVAGGQVTNLPNNHWYYEEGSAYTPVRTYSFVYGLNDSGTVVGYCTWWPGDANQHQCVACYWTGGTVHKMDTLGYNFSESRAINNNGDIAGVVYSDLQLAHNMIYGYHGFLYSNGTMHELAGFTEEPVAINNQGVVLGPTTFYHDGIVESIQSLMPPGWSIGVANGWCAGMATDINESNQVCGWATGPDGQTHGFILQVPEPTTLCLLGLGALALLRRRDSRVTMG